MTAIWCDGFDHWPSKTAMTGGGFYVIGNNPSGGLEAGTAFTYGQAYRAQAGAGQGAYIRKTGLSLQSDNVLILAHQVYVTGNDGSGRIRLLDTADAIIGRLNFALDGTVTYSTGNGTATVVATAAGTAAYVAWHWLVLKVKLASDTTGFVEIWINGVKAAEATGVATRTAGALAFGGIQWVVDTSSGTCRLDDLYIMDTAGSVLNDVIAPSRIITALPNADGAEAEWSPAVNGYQQIDETLSDDDLSYVYSATPGARSSFGISGLDYDPAAIHFVQPIWLARKTDAATRIARLNLKSGATEVAGDDAAQSTSYQWRFGDIHHVDPDTAAPWGRSAVEALEIVLEDASP